MYIRVKEHFFYLSFQNTSIVCLEILGLRWTRFLFHLNDSTYGTVIVMVLLPLQATSCTALEMPTSSEVLQAILEYIYTDEAPTIKGNRPG